MSGVENLFVEELRAYFAERGKRLSSRVVRLLSRSPVDFTPEERKAYYALVAPARELVKDALRERLEADGASREDWVSAFPRYSHTAIGYIVAEVLLETDPCVSGAGEVLAVDEEMEKREGGLGLPGAGESGAGGPEAADGERLREAGGASGESVQDAVTAAGGAGEPGGTDVGTRPEGAGEAAGEKEVEAPPEGLEGAGTARERPEAARVLEGIGELSPEELGETDPEEKEAVGMEEAGEPEEVGGPEGAGGLEIAGNMEEAGIPSAGVAGAAERLRDGNETGGEKTGEAELEEEEEGKVEAPGATPVSGGKGGGEEEAAEGIGVEEEGVGEEEEERQGEAADVAETDGGVPDLPEAAECEAARSDLEDVDEALVKRSESPEEALEEEAAEEVEDGADKEEAQGRMTDEPGHVECEAEAGKEETLAREREEAAGAEAGEPRMGEEASEAAGESLGSGSGGESAASGAGGASDEEEVLDTGKARAAVAEAVGAVGRSVKGEPAPGVEEKGKEGERGCGRLKPSWKLALRVLEWALTVVLVAVILFAAFLMIAPRLGLQAHPVLSGSMEPTLKTGGMVFCRSVPVEEIKVRDIIGFNTPDGRKVTHRVINIEDKEGKRWFQTKGDANEDPDPDLISITGNVVDKVVYHLPYLGFFVSFMQSRFAFLAFLCAPAAILLLLFGRDLWRGLAELRAGKREKG